MAEHDFVKLFKLCYDLNDTDARVLLALLEGGVYTVDDLMQKVGLSRSSITMSLYRLLRAGLVSRRPVQLGSVGRPKYIYRVNRNIYEDVRKCVNRMLNEMLEQLKKLNEGEGRATP